MEIKIESEIVVKPINEIKPYLKNPRANEKTIELLKKIIPVVGFNVPLVIDSKGVIVKGHARYNAALQLGMKELPCIVTHAPAKAIKADRLTDNKIQEFTQWDTARLKEEVGDIDFSALGIDVYDFGFIEANTDTLTKETIDNGEPKNRKNNTVTITIKLKNADEFRANEDDIRRFLDRFEKVEVSADVDDIESE